MRDDEMRDVIKKLDEIDKRILISITIYDTLNEISRFLNLSKSAVSIRLKLLEKLDLVEQKIIGHGKVGVQKKFKLTDLGFKALNEIIKSNKNIIKFDKKELEEIIKYEIKRLKYLTTLRGIPQE